MTTETVQPESLAAPATDLAAGNHLLPSLGSGHIPAESADTDATTQCLRHPAVTGSEEADVNTQVQAGQLTSSEESEGSHATSDTTTTSTTLLERVLLPGSRGNTSRSRFSFEQIHSGSKPLSLSEQSQSGSESTRLSDTDKSSSACSSMPASLEPFLEGSHDASTSGSRFQDLQSSSSSSSTLFGDLHSGSSSERINSALHTLKSELMAMREQDVQLLKQLIDISDSIRRLKRARWLQRGARTASCGDLGARTRTSLPGQAVCPVSGTVKDRVFLLLRQRSEPSWLGLPVRRVSTLTSTSSFETINDNEDEEADSLYGSATDLHSDSTTSPISSPLSPSTRATPFPTSTPCLPPPTRR